MSTINILRQYPAESHNSPLRCVAQRSNLDLSTHEYGLTTNITNVGGNVRFLADLLLQSRGKRVILGAEPFDPLVPIFQRLADRHDVILHTSWPYWEENFVPQPARFGWQRCRWEQFLENVRAIGVTRAATASVSEAGASEAVHIPHAVNTDVYHPAAGSTERDDPVILFVGQLEPRKGVVELVDLIQNWEGPETRFWFVGDGPLKTQVSSLAASNERVEYFGYVADEDRLADLYASSDIFTLPSYRVEGWEELFGIVVIEALACGLPVVATDCVGPKEIIDEGETGYVVQQHDVDALRNRLEMLVSSQNEREQMGEGAREVAEARYRTNLVAEQWRRVLDL